MDLLKKKLNIDETFTKPIKNIKYDSVKANVYPKANYNFMADLLHLPKTKYRYNYLFVIVDLYSNAFDCEPIRTKTPADVLAALKKILSRNYIPEINASIRTDNSGEFGGIFHKWLYHENILHRIAEPNRHIQLANIENLNGVIGNLLNGYMNHKEIETGKIYRQWTDILDIIRSDLNEIRRKPDGDPRNDIMTPPIDKNPKYKIGDIVFVRSERPMSALGEIQPTNSFRKGDYRFDIKNPHTIKQILYYPNNIRYIVTDKKKCSYSEPELILKK